jgi:hypothetical protein
MNGPAWARKKSTASSVDGNVQWKSRSSTWTSVSPACSSRCCMVAGSLQASGSGPPPGGTGTRASARSFHAFAQPPPAHAVIATLPRDTRAISRAAAAWSGAKIAAITETTTSKLSSGNSRCSAFPTRRSSSMPPLAARLVAFSTCSGVRSTPVTTAPRRAASMAVFPSPVPTSSTVSPSPMPSASTVSTEIGRSRNATCE